MKDQTLPKMVEIRQKFETTPVNDLRDTIHKEFERRSVGEVIKPGQSVAVTAGSRGINNIAAITKAIVDELLTLHAVPFIVPAMGSHGGATAQGQQNLLDSLGISKETMGVPICSSMDVVLLGYTDDSIPVFIDQKAHEADHIIAVNRIKPHTDFEGVIESGIFKMLAIGLGNQKAADEYHNQFMQFGHCQVISQAARVILEKSCVSFGIGIVENERDETARIRVIASDSIEAQEKELLLQAKSFLPKIPFDRVDILIVDEIGKIYSGTGMDQNVIGRTVIPYHVVPDLPKIRRIFVRDLAKASGGNGLGIGNADFTTSRCIEKINRDITYMNSITSSCPEIIRTPPFYDTDREAVEACCKTLPIAAWSQARIVHIQNTLHLETMRISESMIPEAESRSGIEIMSPAKYICFDNQGNIVDHSNC